MTNPRFKCRTCPLPGTIYLPEKGEHYCNLHAPIDQRQVPSGSGFEPPESCKDKKEAWVKFTEAIRKGMDSPIGGPMTENELEDLLGRIKKD